MLPLAFNPHRRMIDLVHHLFRHQVEGHQFILVITEPAQQPLDAIRLARAILAAARAQEPHGVSCVLLQLRVGHPVGFRPFFFFFKNPFWIA